MAKVDYAAFESDLGAFVTLLTRALVDKRDSVSCKVLAGDDNAVVEIHCDPTDFGILIGKQGSNINSMTRLVAMAFRDQFAYVKLQVIGAKARLRELEGR